MGLITRRPLTGDQAITQHQGSPANGPPITHSDVNLATVKSPLGKG